MRGIFVNVSLRKCVYYFLRERKGFSFNHKIINCVKIFLLICVENLLLKKKCIRKKNVLIKMFLYGKKCKNVWKKLLLI